MKTNIRFLYLYLACSIFLAGIGVFVCMLLLVYSGGAVRALSNEEQAIIERVAERTDAQETTSIWHKEVSSGQASLSEVVRISFTGTKYLFTGKDDADFALDLSYVLYGSEDRAGELADSLASASRVYVIEQALRSMRADYAPEESRSAEDPEGTRVKSVQLDQPIQDEEGYGFGIRQVSGRISIDGDQVRTDFYIDENLRPGQLTITEDTTGEQSFSMAWDTRSEEAGTHNVKVLLRTSDGRGEILTGGDVVIPSFYTLINDGVQLGFLPVGETDVWYVLDAADRNAYINFVSLTGDIAVTLYDMYGNKIGTNDLPGLETEVLRGRLQTLPQNVTTDPTTISYQNLFYARVQMGTASVSTEEIAYLMVQSKEVAVDADGNFLAVVSDVGIVPTRIPTEPNINEDPTQTVTCKDLSQNTLTYAMEDLIFLPLNGKIASMSFLPSGSSDLIPLSLYPAFSPNTYAYGYVSGAGIAGIEANLSSVEGYAAQIRIEQESESGGIVQVAKDGTIAISPSRNVVHIYVTDFDQITHEYTLYLLSGSDTQGYDVQTLGLFPESYRSGLWLLHNLQPSYQFVPYDTGISWTDLMLAEDKEDKSLTSGKYYPNWVKEGSPVYDGADWKAAKGGVVAYFLDPRNFLDPVDIFQFEKLSFDPTIHTIEGVRSMVKESFLEAVDPDYASILLAAGQESGASPYFLTSRIIQEMGRNGESLLSTGTLPDYEGYYNFYNIGSTPDPEIENGALINGAKFAKWGREPLLETLTPEETALLLPWTSPDLAIRGGALWIASSYIDIGQNTLYFQKFDVVANEDGLYYHQYAQNISMAFSEGIRYHSAYLSQNMLQSTFQFIIPVYLDMPVEYGILPQQS